MNQELSFYDLGVASVLVTLGYRLIKLEKSNPKKVGFVFKREKNIEQVINDYFNDQIKLPALSLLNNQKNLKNRIFSNT
jgi:hypothetical protein